jgi:ABC-2 type transport system ATP-binding protein
MIVVENVSKYYGAHCAVTDLSFEIREGECIGFLGLNGAGKSTTLRLLSCLLLPTSGRIRVRNMDVVENPHAIRKLIGYLPDTPPLYAEMTVAEYLRFAGSLRGLSGNDLSSRAARAVELCNLGDVVHSPIGTLSHGYKQRVGIAQAIIHGPALLILDEPIQGLDPVQIVEMRNMIASLRGEHTILLSTHILTEIERTCDRILMMHRGRIAAEGTEDELAARLRRGRRLELEVAGEEAAIRKALSSVAGADDISLSRTPHASWKATLRVDDAARDKVSRAVVQAGLGLLAMQSASTGLESIFLELSGARAPESLPPPPAGVAAAPPPPPPAGGAAS